MKPESVRFNQKEQMVQEALTMAGSLSDLKTSLDEYAVDEAAGKLDSLAKEGFSFANEAATITKLLANIEAGDNDAALTVFPDVAGGGTVSDRFGLRTKVLRLLTNEQGVDLDLTTEEEVDLPLN